MSFFAILGELRFNKWFILNIRILHVIFPDSKGNYPLHCAIKHCIKHYSPSKVTDLVHVLMTHSSG